MNAERAERWLKDGLIKPSDIIEMDRLVYVNDQLGDLCVLGFFIIVGSLLGYLIRRYWDHEDLRYKKNN